MNPLNTIFEYHERTKHHEYRYAASLGYMDWATQPNPFRSYQGAKKTLLPLAFEHPTPPYHLVYEDGGIPTAPLVLESISQLFQFSLGIAAYKSANGNTWALRCNASSGNLQPTEGYLITPPLHALSEKTAIYHYNPQEHALEILNEFESSFWEELPSGSCLVALASIPWREVWKYGERAFRYVQLDLGHALHALHVSACMLGWELTLVDKTTLTQIDTLLGFDIKERFVEDEKEFSDILLLVTPKSVTKDLTCKIETLLHDMPSHTQTIANRLSQNHHHWNIIDIIEKATHQNPSSSLALHVSIQNSKKPSFESKEIILKRRSAQMMDAGRSKITKEQFFTLLESVAHTKADVHLAIFLHNIDELVSGLYFFVRDEDDLENLKQNFDPHFLWEEIAKNFYLLQEGDFKAKSKQISCSQDIAKDGAFSLGIIAKFSSVLSENNPQKYKELYYECGAIGQQLYLEATSLRLHATGIGCFLDDMMHALLGLQNNGYQSLYHFTIGRAIIDMRIQTLQPYTLRD